MLERFPDVAYENSDIEACIRSKRLFVSAKTSKAYVDLLVHAVGGDGFEPPTPAL